MAFDVDEEILADFLVEAGEILELLQVQLVELENNPEDTNLLNAIFRGYHTVKGGAGFLSLTELVDICHGAENVFDVMRNGQRTLTHELMDVILQATDEVVQMFDLVKAGEPLVAAEKSLIDTLTRLSKPELFDKVAAASEPKSAVNITTANESAASSDFSEEEFEALLDELHGNDAPGAKEDKAPEETSLNDQDISDDEFEALLDQLHGKGQFKGEDKADTEQLKESPVAPEPSPSGDDISDDEFEALLDQLHGKGKGPAEVVSEKSFSVKESQPAIEPPEVKKAITPPDKVEVAQPIIAKKEEKKSAAPPQGETTVRVDTKRLDQIMNMVGELVLVRNRLLSLSTNVNDESMAKAIANLDVVTGDLQGAVMKTRMQPIKKVFGRFPRVVRDLARTLKKEITLVLEGEETDLDKNLVEALADPLVHLVRNSVDHGIEMPEKRKAAGKPTMGTVKLTASQEGDHILLSIIDDGKGMDPEKLKEIAVSRGVMDADAASRMTDVDAFNLIFAPGFSTKTEISEVSGRGVGMDVVKTKINQLNGTVSIDSKMGIGTTLEIKVPLTLAILPTLMIVIGKQTFALPLGSVNEIINLDMRKTNTVDGQLTMIVRSKAIPLFYLGEWLARGEVNIDKTKGHVVVVQIGTKQLGFVVDALIGQEEVVIKPLDELLQGTPGMAGATITSDGGIALILDVPGLLKRYAAKKS
ncbi:chemotaxis protein CheA [Paraglaciecola psychrophila]|uniref:Chemotaxis protein CheA n=1 Tax=Paraglaciecola psychrophila 170 TaxID=1129794 RepID=K7ASQ7_9ALTE|nr:chemotaxis protein CheA [Paraglaciecola psychrophila]AGH45757.1 CheA signal transduction histidine kinase [Paraglaciecola psychrophila 170]GAC38275.1 two-component system, chemotaxis family, sensor kinase CheA [Paraglaciecola psychrophila 170]